MSYLIWNTETEAVHRREQDGRYTQDGAPGSLTSPLVELEVLSQPYPALGLNERAISTQTVDLTDKTFTRGWRVETYEPSQAELDERALQAEADQMRQAYTALKNGTTTAQQQRNIIAFLLKCEASRRGLIVQ
jgi:hypothetical protein